MKRNEQERMVLGVTGALLCLIVAGVCVLWSVKVSGQALPTGPLGPQTTTFNATVKIGSNNCVPNTLLITNAANAGTAAFVNAATLTTLKGAVPTLTPLTVTITYMLDSLTSNTITVVTGVVFTATAPVTNASLATATANAVTNAVGTRTGVLSLTPANSSY